MKPGVAASASEGIAIKIMANKIMGGLRTSSVLALTNVALLESERAARSASLRQGVQLSEELAAVAKLHEVARGRGHALEAYSRLSSSAVSKNVEPGGRYDSFSTSRILRNRGSLEFSALSGRSSDSPKSTCQ